MDQFHNDNERNRRDVGLSFYNEEVDLVENNQDKDFNDNKLTNLDSLTVNRNPSSDNELTREKYVDVELEKNTIVRFNQTLENFLKVSAGSDVYNLTNHNKKSITDITEIKFPNIGTELLQNWKIYCNNKNNPSRITDFKRSTKSNSPTSEAGATSPAPIGNAFMYIETSGINSGNDIIFVSWERTDIFQITNITFYDDRYSILTNVSEKSIGRFRIQLRLEDNTWSTQNTIPKNSQYSNTSTEWTLLNLFLM